MTGLRSLVFRYRLLAMLLVAAALCVRIVLPAGTMIAPEPKVLTIRICVDSLGHDGIAQIAVPMKGLAGKTGSAAKGECAFSSLAMAATGGAVPALRRGLYLGEPAVDTLTADAPLVQTWVDVRLADGWSITPRLQHQEFNTAFTQIRLRAPDAANPAIINRNGRRGREDDAYTIAQLDLTGRLVTGPFTHKC